jgi:peptide/nickel transport system ATP-binding protein
MTAHALLGLHDPRRVAVSGTILIDGQQIVGASDRQLRRLRGGRVGMIFQDPLASLHPYYSIGRQIAETYRAHVTASKTAARRRAIDILGRVGIPEPGRRVDSYPHELSGGMRQRAMIAMAVVCDPDLLIADEPTTALDVTVQAQILDLLGDLQRDFGSAIIYISHDLAVVNQMAEEVLVMYAGRCVEHGSTEQVLRRPRHPYTWGLLASIPTLTGDPDVPLASIPGNSPNLIEHVPGCAFHPRCPYAGETSGRAYGEVPLLRPVPDDAGHSFACHLEEPAW